MVTPPPGANSRSLALAVMFDAMFAPCPSCRRHVRVDEASCPFCGSALAALDATPDATTRMSRARLFVFATTLGVSAATLACPKETDGGGGGGGGIVQPYGAPPRPPEPVDAATNEQPETSAIAPPATIEPPPPATAPTPGAKPGPGAPAAAYGAPPEPFKPTP